MFNVLYIKPLIIKENIYDKAPMYNDSIVRSKDKENPKLTHRIIHIVIQSQFMLHMLFYMN